MTAAVTGTRDRATRRCCVACGYIRYGSLPWVSALAPESGLNPDQWVGRTAAAAHLRVAACDQAVRGSLYLAHEARCLENRQGLFGWGV